MEQAMAGAGETLLLSDADGIVFLSSERKLRYRALAPLNEKVMARLSETRQYGNQPISPLAEQPIPAGQQASPLQIALPDETSRERLITTRPVGTQGWQVCTWRSRRSSRCALGAAIAVAFAVATLGLAAHFRHRTRVARARRA
jgi:two-component system C4-dicarboxylate transport sensor histidine kinase DctB